MGSFLKNTYAVFAAGGKNRPGLMNTVLLILSTTVVPDRSSMTNESGFAELLLGPLDDAKEI
jgi:hypothetical protein